MFRGDIQTYHSGNRRFRKFYSTDKENHEGDSDWREQLERECCPTEARATNWYLTLRKILSSLISEGHTDAANYPLSRLIFEFSLVERRLNMFHATQAVLIHSAINAALNKDSHKQFTKLIGKLNDGPS